MYIGLILIAFVNNIIVKKNMLQSNNIVDGIISLNTRFILTEINLMKYMKVAVLHG